MLVLSRKVGERVKIGDDIEVMVTDVRRDGVVKLGITAPKDKFVIRSELAGRPRKKKPSQESTADHAEDADG